MNFKKQLLYTYLVFIIVLNYFIYIFGLIKKILLARFYKRENLDLPRLGKFFNGRRLVNGRTTTEIINCSQFNE